MVASFLSFWFYSHTALLQFISVVFRLSSCSNYYLHPILSSQLLEPCFLFTMSSRSVLTIIGVRVHHGYTPGYWGLTRTRTHDGSVPAPRVRVWSQVPSLVPVPVPVVGIPVGYEQEGGPR